MSINQRVEELENFYKSKGITLAKFIKVNYQTIKNITGDRQSNPSHKILESILRADPTINIRWLILGEGEMFATDTSIDEKKELIELKKKVLELEANQQKIEWENKEIKRVLGSVKRNLDTMMDSFNELDLDELIELIKQMPG